MANTNGLDLGALQGGGQTANANKLCLGALQFLLVIIGAKIIFRNRDYV